MSHYCYSSVLLDAQGRFSPAQFVRAFMEATEREGIAYCTTPNVSRIFSEQQPPQASMPSLNRPQSNRSDSAVFQSPSSSSPRTVSRFLLQAPRAPASFSSSVTSPPARLPPHGTSTVPAEPACNKFDLQDEHSDVAFSSPLSNYSLQNCRAQLLDQTSESEHERLSSTIALNSASTGATQQTVDPSFLEGLEAISDEEDDDEENTEQNTCSSLDQRLASSGPGVRPRVVCDDVSASTSQSYSVRSHAGAAVGLEATDGAGKRGTNTLNTMAVAPTHIRLEGTYAPSGFGAGFVEPAPDVCAAERLNTAPLSTNCSQTVVFHKLKLVLDLDNTLLHACSQSKLSNVNIPLEDFESPAGDPELYKFKLSNITSQLYYVKFRPGLRRFLSEVSRYCDLGIHTNATHEYADVIVAILDPDYSLFQGRVAAREDETTKDHKKNMDRLFRVDDLDLRSLVILDDRKDVWDDMYHPNIIKCGMYDYLDARKAALSEKYRGALEETPFVMSTESLPVTDNALEKHTEEGLGLSGDEEKLNTVAFHDASGASATAAMSPETVLQHDQNKTEEQQSESFLYAAAPSECTHPVQEQVTDTEPFVDNPLVEQSGLDLPQGLHDADICEDDDIIAPHAEVDHDETSVVTDTTSLLTPDVNDDQKNPCVAAAPETADTVTSKLDTTTVTAQDQRSSERTDDLAALFGVEEKSVTDSMRNAAQLSHLDQALIDFDTQLDEIRKLIVDVATEYNRLKSSPSTAETASVAQLLADRRKSILQGVVVQTAGMFKSETSHPEFGWHDNGPLHRRRLVRLGAHVVESPVPELTHIVAIRATQTLDRVRLERGSEVHYVHALWLHACESTWRRVPEAWFPALPLLRKYNYTPPMKPWVDHWRLLALHEPAPNKRLLLALKKCGLSTIRSNQAHVSAPTVNGEVCNAIKDAMEDAMEDASETAMHIPASSCSNVISLEGQRRTERTEAVRSQQRRNRHLVVSPGSAGAQVWSAKEFITLVYDATESLLLKQRLQCSSLNSSNDTPVSNKSNNVCERRTVPSESLEDENKQYNGVSIAESKFYSVGAYTRGRERRKRARLGGCVDGHRYGQRELRFYSNQRWSRFSSGRLSERTATMTRDFHSPPSVLTNHPYASAGRTPWNNRNNTASSFNDSWDSGSAEQFLRADNPGSREWTAGETSDVSRRRWDDSNAKHAMEAAGNAESNEFQPERRAAYVARHAQAASSCERAPQASNFSFYPQENKPPPPNSNFFDQTPQSRNFSCTSNAAPLPYYENSTISNNSFTLVFPRQ